MRKEIIAFKAKYDVPPLIGYLPALYPDIPSARDSLKLAYDAGLRFIETGFPTDNPYLDGDVIRKALLELDGKSISPEDRVIESGRLIKSSGLLGIAMLYEESLEAYGSKRFIADAASFGFDAILVPNISPKNRTKLYFESDKTGIEIVNFIGINNSLKDIEVIAQETTGFLYMQSTDGATGGQFVVNEESVEKMKKVKEIASRYDLPVALGFGINSPYDADMAAEIGADGVIIGTAFMKALQSGSLGFKSFLSGFNRFLEGQE